MCKTSWYNKKIHMTNKFKVQCSKCQEAQTSCTSFYCFYISVIVALTIETVFSYLKYTWEFYIELVAISCQIFIMLNL